MSNVLFVNGNAHGHINPTLPLAKELVARGEKVFYFSTSEFKEKIEGTGAVFFDYGESLAQFFNHFKPSGGHPFYTLIEFLLKMDQVVVPIVLDQIKGSRVDYLIHDSMFGGGSVLSKKLGLPAVCSCTSFAMNRLPMPPYMFEPGFHPQLDHLYRELEIAAKAWEMETLRIMDIFFKKEDMNLVFTSRYFQPEAESFDGSFHFIGPSIAARAEELDFPLNELEGCDVVYISMGTINNHYSMFYSKCMKAFAGENFKVVLSVGKKTDIASLGKIPDNFIIRNYVPQLEVLKKTNVFISHGGLNSVSEALYYSVPVIAIPQANDQPMVTRQLVTLGAGIGLKMDEVTPQLLKDSVHKILSEQSFRSAGQKIGHSFMEAGGYKTAADHILNFKKSWSI